MYRKRNQSKKIPVGTTFQTRDEFISSDGYKKQGYQNKGFYRRVVAVATNKNDEMAIVKLQGHTGLALPNYRNGLSRFRPYITVLDSSGQPLKGGSKFRRNNQQFNVSKTDVNMILSKCVVFPENRRKLQLLKNRKKQGTK